ncbi:gephyrin-like molybdotransferase Glp [Thiohalorhabdus methylotrophus]|uniref:Molybdopterin molybdenumtransferase n=1 Tax=Thiohalorhabdus methylotrophus TaxID=3242694 RepID=A0ABV4TYS5_9GAMM
MPQGRSTQPDVRMRGFSHRAPVETVWQWLEETARPLPGETLHPREAHRRILAEEVTAPESVPPFPRSAMDGYALRGSETVGAGAYNPLSFRLVGQSMPGAAHDQPLPPGAAVRIMTGAPVPEGADAVLPAEYAQEVGERVEVTNAIPPWKHVGQIGEDIQEGEVLLRPGRKLRPQDLGLLASVGRTSVTVVARPRVRILVTGNELVPSDQPRGNAQIYDANTDMLAALVERDGGTVEGTYRVGDDADVITEHFTEGSPDVLIVTGGSSVGAEDHAPRVLSEAGELAFHGVAMRPSAPTGMGRLGADTLAFLLPGNPVSCLAGYDFFAGRAVRRLGGRPSHWPHPTVSATLARKISSEIGRMDYCRVALGDEGVEPLALSGASILSSTTRADGFVIIPADSEGYAPGTAVTVHLYEPGD